MVFCKKYLINALLRTFGHSHKFSRCLVALLMLVSIACICFAQDECVDLDITASYKKPFFGNDRTVSLMGDILKSEDIYQRVQATANLGQTNNLTAIDFISLAAKDSSPLVRAAAVQAAACFPENKKTQDLILTALDDKNQNVQLTAISEASNINLKASIEKIISLAKTGPADIQIASFNALIKFQTPADSATLQKCFSSDNLRLKLAAAKNALFASSAQADEIKNTVINLTDDKDSPVQAAAVKFIGKFYLKKIADEPASKPASTQPSSKPAKKIVDPYQAIVAKSGNSKDPILRRSTVAAYSLSGINELIPAFLDDKSRTVRNAALIALAKQPVANSGLIIFEIWEAANDELTNQLCSDALLALADNTVRQSMLEYIESNIDTLAGINRLEEKARYNLLELKMVTACNLLGNLKYKPAFNALIDCLEKVGLDSKVLGASAVALGKIGNPAAIRTLEKVLDKALINGKKYLIAMATMRTPPPFSSAQAAMIIKALGMLKSTSDVDKIITLSGLNYMGVYLTEPAAQGCETLPLLVTNSNKEKIEKFIIYMVKNSSSGAIAKLKAIRAAGILKIKETQPELEYILNEDRSMKILMQAAAWSIGQISGKTPAVGKPVANNSDWIIKSLE